MTVLEGIGITKRFGGRVAVEDVSVAVHAGRVAAVIGPNGAGKTTLFSCLTGAASLDGGTVLLDGTDVTSRGADDRARRGLGRTFQRLSVFGSLSVADNLLVGAEAARRTPLWRGLLGLPDRRASGDAGRVDRVLALLGLEDVRDQEARTLSTGRLRLVELGRALCGEPRVLLLDEPASGLSDAETDGLRAVLRAVADDGVAVLLVEHDVRLVLDVADHVYALAQGRMLSSGTPDEVAADPAVRSAYLDRTRS
ncbi:MAG: branched-chain amino acid transport system ATP-binding protein [Frankiales bacterium]|nr:branched-chain amino acid transport system ATP-binding protein [Frankiales bacterium]